MLDAKSPEFVRVRVSVDDKTPILLGTTASIQGSFTGPSTVQLDGAKQGKPLISCEQQLVRARRAGDPGQTRRHRRAAVERAAIARTADDADRAADRVAQRPQPGVDRGHPRQYQEACRKRCPIAVRKSPRRSPKRESRSRRPGIAAEQIGNLAATTNGLLANDIKPTIGNLNKTIEAAKRSMQTLDAAIGDARPGLQSFSKQTIPEVGQLVHDLREMAAALSSVAEKVDRGGAGSIIGSPKLPDYKGKK